MIRLLCCQLLTTLVVFNIAGCSTSPPTAHTSETPDLPAKRVSTQRQVALSATQLEASLICRQMALQATHNAFAAEKEQKEKLFQALDNGSIADIQSGTDEADQATERLREAIQLSSKIVQLNAAARTAQEAAERNLQAAMRTELKADALKALKKANRESKTAIDLVEKARDLSDKLKEVWLVREPLPRTGQQPPAQTNAAIQPEVSVP